LHRRAASGHQITAGVDQMKFEWDIARNILQTIEVLHYHLALISQRHLIESRHIHGLDMAYPQYHVLSMTLAGHEILEVMRNDTMWGNIKNTVKEKGLSLTFDTIKAAGVWLIHRAFS
jgi:hypothetical protein